MSNWSDYQKEREGSECIEWPEGFAVYKVNAEDKSCYISIIYVNPENRSKRFASRLCDKVADVARQKGCNTLIGTVDPYAEGATHSMFVQIQHGFKINRLHGSLIVLQKDISGGK